MPTSEKSPTSQKRDVGHPDSLWDDFGVWYISTMLNVLSMRSLDRGGGMDARFESSRIAATVSAWWSCGVGCTAAGSGRGVCCGGWCGYAGRGDGGRWGEDAVADCIHHVDDGHAASCALWGGDLRQQHGRVADAGIEPGWRRSRPEWTWRDRDDPQGVRQIAIGVAEGVHAVYNVRALSDVHGLLSVGRA